jgi:polysaccharide pyruvyl transferase WcaK-like protein
MRPARVGLIAAQSIRNLGDTATLAAMISALRRRLGQVELTAVVPAPSESAPTLTTAGFPLYGDGAGVGVGEGGKHVKGAKDAPVALGRLLSIRRIFSFSARLDAIVFTGGGLLDDFWGGPWSLPFYVFVWTAAARLRGLKVSFLAIGFDRLSACSSRWLAVNGLRLAHFRSFRDDESRRLLTSMGLRHSSEVMPDLAFALETGELDASAENPESPPYVILNPVSERMWTHLQDTSYVPYLDAFAGLARSLLDRGFAVKLLSTQDTMDAAALSYVAQKLGAVGGSNWEYRRVTQLDVFMRIARQAQLVVSSRLHGLILPLVAGTPVVSVSPMRKMSRVMIDAGLGDLNVEVAGLQGSALLAIVDRAMDERATLRRKIAATVTEYRRKLNSEFSGMIRNGLLGEAARMGFAAGGNLEPRNEI